MNENMDRHSRVTYRIKRPTYSQKDFDVEYHDISRSRFTVSKAKSAFRKIRLRTFGFELFPIFKSLISYYNVHLFLLDLIAGITMAFFHLPQGMAYGALAGLRPVNGLYTSFFPVLVYFFFATSRHNSFGTFSLAALLFSNPINRLTHVYYAPGSPSNSTYMSNDEYAFRLNLSLTLAFCVGMLQFIMALIQVGFLATYLSGPMISGFMCASAFHVTASQLNDLFGLRLPRVYGPGNLFIKIYNLGEHITQTNVATIVICIICIIGLHIFRLYINPFFKKKFKFPIPVELLIVILSTVISHFANFSSRWGVQVVGEIPSGLPKPTVPTFAYFSELLPDIFVIAIITFAINAGLVKTYASEFAYKVLDNQELLALGISNLFGSFFQCHTACGALGRTAVVVTIGMASQIASLISCGIFLLILFFIAPYLESLPRAVLGCIVCVALTSTFKKVLDLKHLWKVSKIDASIWLVSFLTTLAVDIIYGVAIGFVYSILTIVFRSQRGGHLLLGEAKDTDLYCDLKRFEELHELDGIKIIRYDGPVYFANVSSFQKSIYHLSGMDPIKVRRNLNKHEGGCKFFPSLKKKSSAEAVDDESNPPEYFEPEVDIKTDGASKGLLQYLILDASGWLFTDTVGLRGIKEMIKNYFELEVTIFVAALRPRLREMFRDSGVFSVIPEENFFVSLHDAVLVALAQMRTDDVVGTPRGNRNLHRHSTTAIKLRSPLDVDPDTFTDLSVLGEERAVSF